MKIDKIDIEIFKTMIEGKEATTTQIAKKLFQPKDDYELRIKDNFIRMRLKKWVNLGVLEMKEENGKKIYTISKDKVFLGDASLVIETPEQTAVLDLGKGILFKTNDTWFLYEFKE